MNTTGNSIEIAPNVRLTGTPTDDASDRELHVRDGSNLPALCVDCGAPVRGKPDVRTYRGFAPGAWWLFLFKAGLRHLVVRLFGRKAEIGAFVCDTHETNRRTKRTVGLIGIISALPIAMALGAAGAGSAITVLVFFVWSLVSFSIRWGGTDLLSPKGITEERVAVFEAPNDKFVQAVTRAGAR